MVAVRVDVDGVADVGAEVAAEQVDRGVDGERDRGAVGGVGGLEDVQVVDVAVAVLRVGRDLAGDDGPTERRRVEVVGGVREERRRADRQDDERGGRGRERGLPEHTQGILSWIWGLWAPRVPCVLHGRPLGSSSGCRDFPTGVRPVVRRNGRSDESRLGLALGAGAVRRLDDAARVQDPERVEGRLDRAHDADDVRPDLLDERRPAATSPIPCSAVTVPPSAIAAREDLVADEVGQLRGPRVVVVEDEVRVEVAVAGVAERRDPDAVPVGRPPGSRPSSSGTRPRGTPTSSIRTGPLPLERAEREPAGLAQPVGLGRVLGADQVDVAPAASQARDRRVELRGSGGRPAGRSRRGASPRRRDPARAGTRRRPRGSSRGRAARASPG